MPIEVKNLFHVYNKKTEIENTALKNVNLKFNDHFFAGLVGKTGSGKSTLAQHLNYLIKVEEGEIRVDDFLLSSDKKKMKKFKPNNLRSTIGYLFQFSENQLFEESILKDVMFGPLNFGKSKQEAEQLAKEALKIVGICSEFENRNPFELSGGEKRRIALAGVLACKPKYLILDEPTAGLDNIGKSMIINLLNNLYEQGISILLITHDMDLVLNICKEVVLMVDGEVKKHVSVEEFFKENLEDYSIKTPNIINFTKGLNNIGFVKNIEELLEVLKNE